MRNGLAGLISVLLAYCMYSFSMLSSTSDTCQGISYIARLSNLIEVESCKRCLVLLEQNRRNDLELRELVSLL